MGVRSWPKAFKKSLQTAFPNFWWAAVSLLATVSTAPIVIAFGFGEVPDQRDSLYFLLGAQTETLGTIFVLAFTLSVVAAQVATRYHRVLFDRILGGWALWYALPFGVGIILPLFLLHGCFFLWSTRISLLIAVYCVSSLLPFTVAVRKLLSISEALTEKQNEIRTANSREERERLIGELSDIAIGAMYVNDYAAFETGLKKMAMLADDRGAGRQLELLVSAEIVQMLRQNAGNQFASETLLTAMTKIGLNKTPEDDTDVSVAMLSQLSEAYKLAHVSTLRSHTQVVRSIGQYALAAISGHQVSETRSCQNILYTIGERSIAELPAASETGREAVATIGEIIRSTLSSDLTTREQDYLIYHGIVQIETLATKARAVDQTRIAASSQVQLLGIMRNNSASAQRIHGRAEASLAVFGET